jgi:hypothetical protein
LTELPAGTVTFLFTDLEASTRLWEEYPEAMREALARHDEILRSAIDSRDVGDTSNLGFILFEMLDGLARIGGHDAFVAQLGGALKEGFFQVLLLQTSGDELTRREAALMRVRESTDPDTYELAFARGAALTYDEVIDLALAKLDDLLAEPTAQEVEAPG